MEEIQLDNAETTDASSNRPPLKPVRHRRWVFRLMAVVLGIAPIVLLEVMLRVLGMGRDLALVTPVPKSPGWYRLNSQFDEPYFGQTDLSGPDNKPFRLPKPKGTFRILVVGGSTVVGFPYPSELAFSRHLELELNAQSDGGETFEVLNAGITAMNTSTEVAVIQEGLKAQPDAIVVYTGHNEFYGPGGVASSAGWLNPTWYRTAAVWRRLYLFQVVRRLTKVRKPTKDLFESLPVDIHIELGSETYQNGVKRFRENLTAMALLAKKANIPMVFITPVANMHHQPPIENMLSKHKGSRHEWLNSLDEADREMRWGEMAKGIEQIEAIVPPNDPNPIIHFRLAQALEQAERNDEAQEQFSIALDFDGCRFRAPNEFRQIVSEVAAQYQASGAIFMDLYKVICDQSEIGVPGRAHFLEHVHFTWDGNRLVGNEIAKSIWQDILKRKWSSERMLDDQTMREKLAVQDEDHLAAMALAMTIYDQSPFGDGIDADKMKRVLAEESLEIFNPLPLDRQRLFKDRTQKEMAGDLLKELIRVYREKNEDNEVLLETWLQARVVRQPWNCEAVNELINWLNEHGNSTEADRIINETSNWPCPR